MEFAQPATLFYGCKHLYKWVRLIEITHLVYKTPDQDRSEALGALHKPEG